MNHHIARVLTGIVTSAVMLTGCQPSDAVRSGNRPLQASTPTTNPTPRAVTGEMGSRVLEVLPHDTTVFTQGLEMIDHEFLQSAGRYGESRLQVLDAHGLVLREESLPDDVFGEGLTTDGEIIWVLTWKEGKILRYRWPELTSLDPLPLDTEGWGVCLDDDMLVTSDGSSVLQFRDPNTGESQRSVDVGRSKLNELECVGDGTVWANVFMESEVIRIDLGTGDIVETFDASDLVNHENKSDHNAVLNGIALAEDGTLWLTGKWWDNMYRVKPDHLV